MTDGKLKILLVDDDEDDYVVTRDMLSEVDGYRIDLDWVSAYDAALEAVGQNGYDVYLFDYRLGERNGLELLGEAVAKGCDGPIILLTGQGDRDVDVEAMKAGASDYLVKGEISANLLERSIRYALERKRSEEQIVHMAYYDNLTGLPNRTLFGDRLRQAMVHADRHQTLAAVFFLDLDNFKRINDTLGHRTGDLLLKEVAERLTGCVRRSDTVGRQTPDKFHITFARLGGDEFTVLLSELKHHQNATLVGKRILDVLSQPFTLDGHEVFVTASVGIAIYPQDGEDMDSLLKNADAAMYNAKEQGKKNFQFYQQSMNSTALEKLTLENDLHKAVERKEFLSYYQPQIDLVTGRIVGMEALIRWHHPGRGMVSPADFLPIAEETGLIIPISEWVLQDACRQNKAWHDAGFSKISISVNLSRQQFRQANLATSLLRILESSGLEPGFLILEITESIIMQHLDVAIATLDTLTRRGIRLAMDDFGTGYSSLRYLKRLPLYAITIDRSFIKEIPAIPDDAVIPRAIIALAHGLNLKVVAEGVETEQQFQVLKEQGCDVIQGFLLNEPLPAEEATKLLTKERDGTFLGSQFFR